MNTGFNGREKEEIIMNDNLKFKRPLEDELTSRTEDLTKVIPGTEESKNKVDDYIKLCNTSIEMRKLEIEAEDREEKRKMDQIDRDRTHELNCRRLEIEEEHYRKERKTNTWGWATATTLTVVGIFAEPIINALGSYITSDSSRGFIKNCANSLSNFAKRRHS